MATLPEELIWEILLRLPPKHILRFRAVCKAWCDRAADSNFILNHHSRQPRQPLILSSFDGPSRPNDRLEAVNLSTNERRMVLVRRSYSDDAVGSYYPFDALVVHRSCDGLLLLGFRKTFLVCNPATRQGTRLGLLFRDGRDIVGFYKHADSGEYRVLYHQIEGSEGRYYYVRTLGSQHAARSITSSADLGAELARRLARGLDSSITSPPVLVRGSLHWSPQQSQDFHILVFDPAAESFRWIPPPSDAMLDKGHHTQLFEMMEGTLAVFCWHHSAKKSVIWFMEDYHQVNWVKYPVELSVKPPYDPFRLPPCPAILYQEGDMLEPAGPRTVSRYDKMGKLQGSVVCFDRRLTITPHMLKESLAFHEFLQKRRNDGAAEWFPVLEFADGSDTAISGPPHMLKESFVLRKRRNDGAADCFPALEFADGSDTASSGDETQTD